MQIIEQDDKDDEYERNESVFLLDDDEKKNLKEAEQKTRLKKKAKTRPAPPRCIRMFLHGQ